MYFDQLLDFQIELLLFIIVPYFTLWMLDFFNTIRVSNNLDPDQAQHFVEPDFGPSVCKGYQQTTKVTSSGQRVKYKATC